MADTIEDKIAKKTEVVQETLQEKLTGTKKEEAPSAESRDIYATTTLPNTPYDEGSYLDVATPRPSADGPTPYTPEYLAPAATTWESLQKAGAQVAGEFLQGAAAIGEVGVDATIDKAMSLGIPGTDYLQESEGFQGFREGVTDAFQGVQDIGRDITTFKDYLGNDVAMQRLSFELEQRLAEEKVGDQSLVGAYARTVMGMGADPAQIISAATSLAPSVASIFLLGKVKPLVLASAGRASKAETDLLVDRSQGFIKQAILNGHLKGEDLATVQEMLSYVRDPSDVLNITAIAAAMLEESGSDFKYEKVTQRDITTSQLLGIASGAVDYGVLGQLVRFNPIRAASPVAAIPRVGVTMGVEGTNEAIVDALDQATAKAGPLSQRFSDLDQQRQITAFTMGVGGAGAMSAATSPVEIAKLGLSAAKAGVDVATSKPVVGTAKVAAGAAVGAASLLIGKRGRQAVKKAAEKVGEVASDTRTKLSDMLLPTDNTRAALKAMSRIPVTDADRSKMSVGGEAVSAEYNPLAAARSLMERGADMARNITTEEQANEMVHELFYAASEHIRNAQEYGERIANDESLAGKDREAILREIVGVVESYTKVQEQVSEDATAALLNNDLALSTTVRDSLKDVVLNSLSSGTQTVEQLQNMMDLPAFKDAEAQRKLKAAADIAVAEAELRSKTKDDVSNEYLDGNPDKKGHYGIREYLQRAEAAKNLRDIKELEALRKRMQSWLKSGEKTKVTDPEVKALRASERALLGRATGEVLRMEKELKASMGTSSTGTGSSSRTTTNTGVKPSTAPSKTVREAFKAAANAAKNAVGRENKIQALVNSLKQSLKKMEKGSADALAVERAISKAEAKRSPVTEPTEQADQLELDLEVTEAPYSELTEPDVPDVPMDTSPNLSLDLGVPEGPPVEHTPASVITLKEENAKSKLLNGKGLANLISGVSNIANRAKGIFSFAVDAAKGIFSTNDNMVNSRAAFVLEMGKRVTKLLPDLSQERRTEIGRAVNELHRTLVRDKDLGLLKGEGEKGGVFADIDNPLTLLMVTDADGKKRLPATVRAAIQIAALNWAQTLGRQNTWRTADSVKALLGMQETDRLSSDLYQKYRFIGSRRDTAGSNIGAAVVRSLGIKFDPSLVPAGFKANFDAAVGAAALGYLTEKGIIRDPASSSVPAAQWAADITAATGTAPTSKNLQAITFVQLVHNEGEVAENVEAALAPFKTFPQMADVVLENASAPRPASSTPSDRVNSTTSKGSVINKRLQKALVKYQQTANKTNQNLKSLLTQPNAQEILEQLLGLADFDPSTVHASRRQAAESANADAKREIIRLLDAYAKNPDMLDGDIFLESEYSFQLRNRMINSDINPQNYKSHRDFVSVDAANVTVDAELAKDQGALDLLYQGALIALGMDESTPSSAISHAMAAVERFKKMPKELGKKMDDFLAGNEVSAKIVKEILEEFYTLPEMQGLLRQVKGETDSTKAVKTPTDLAALNVALNIHQMLQVQRGEIGSFTGQFEIEIDGKTNGFFLLGAQLPVLENMNTWYERTGMYVEGDSEFSSFNEYITQDGSLDSYQAVASELQGEGADPVLIEFIEFFTGELMKDGKVTKVLRDIMKNPFMIFNYGSSLGRIKKDARFMLEGFIMDKAESINADARAASAMEKGEARDAAIASVKAELAEFNERLGTKLTVKTILEDAKTLEAAIKKHVHDFKLYAKGTKEGISTVGTLFAEMLSDAIESSMGAMVPVRDAINKAFIHQWEMYDSALSAGIARLEEQGEVTQKDVDDLTSLLAPLLPHYHGATDSKGVSSESRIPIFDVETTVTPNSKVQVSFKNKNVLGGQGSLTLQGLRREIAHGGVSGFSIAVHSQDAVIMSRIYEAELSSQGRHDATAVGALDRVKASQTANKATAEIVGQYSMLHDFMKSMQESLAYAIERGAETSPESVLLLTQSLTNLRPMIEEIHADRVAALDGKQVTIDQYPTLQGEGAVTDTMRITPRRIEGFQAVTEAYNRAKQAVLESPPKMLTEFLTRFMMLGENGGDTVLMRELRTYNKSHISGELGSTPVDALMAAVKEMNDNPNYLEQMLENNPELYYNVGTLISELRSLASSPWAKDGNGKTRQIQSKEESATRAGIMAAVFPVLSKKPSPKAGEVVTESTGQTGEVVAPQTETNIQKEYLAGSESKWLRDSFARFIGHHTDKADPALYDKSTPVAERLSMFMDIVRAEFAARAADRTVPLSLLLKAYAKSAGRKDAIAEALKAVDALERSATNERVQDTQPAAVTDAGASSSEAVVEQEVASASNSFADQVSSVEIPKAISDDIKNAIDSLKGDDLLNASANSLSFDIRLKHGVKSGSPEWYAISNEASKYLNERQSAEKSKYPDGPFTGATKSVVGGSKVDPRVVAFVQGLADMLGMRQRIFIYTPTDVEQNSNENKLFGDYAIITDPQGRLGDKKMGISIMFGPSDKDAAIQLSENLSLEEMLEVVSHEFGHIVEKTAFAEASAEVKAAVVNAHAEWLRSTNGKLASEVFGELKMPALENTLLEMLEGIGGDRDFSKTRPAYFGSFAEWFADNVSRWALNDAKPKTLVEKFFSDVASAIKKILGAMNKSKYAPNKTLAEFLDGLAEPNFNPDSITATVEQTAENAEEVDDRPWEKLFSFTDPKTAPVDPVQLAENSEIQHVTRESILGLFNNLLSNSTVSLDSETVSIYKSLIDKLIGPALEGIGEIGLKIREGVEGIGGNFGALTSTGISIVTGMPRTLNAQSSAEVLLHELVHRFSFEALVKDPEARAQLSELFEIARKTVDYTVFLRKDADGNTIHLGDPQAEIDHAKAMYDYVFNNPDRITVEGTVIATGLVEFVAYALTNPALMQKLKTVDPRGVTPTGEFLGAGSSKNLLGQLFNWMYRAFSGLLDMLDGTPKGKDVHQRVFNLVMDLNGLQEKHIKLHERKLVRKAGSNIDAINSAVKNFADNVTGALNNGKVSSPQIEALRAALKIKLVEAGAALNGATKAEVDRLIEQVKNSDDPLETIRKSGMVEKYALFQDDGFVASIRDTMTGKLSKEGPNIARVLNRATSLVDRMRETLRSGVKESVKSGFIQKLTNVESEAITAPLLSADIGSLADKYGIVRAGEFLKNESARKQEIARLVAAVKGNNSKYSNGLLKQVRGMAAVIMTGDGAVANQVSNITTLVNGSPWRSLKNFADSHSDPVQMHKDLDALYSLYALGHVSEGARNLTSRVWDREFAANAEVNGITNVLELHRGMKKTALKQIFDNNPNHVVKGWTPQMYDPNLEWKQANEADGKELERLGWKKVMTITTKLEGKSLAMYTRKSNGGSALVKGAFGYEGRRSRGTDIAESYTAEQGGYEQQSIGEAVAQAKKVYDGLALRQMSETESVPKYKLPIAILDGEGNVTTYSHIMGESTKRQVLGKTSRIEEVMGDFSARTAGKRSSENMNLEVLGALKEDYETNYEKAPEDFVWVTAAEWNDDGSYNKYFNEYRMLSYELKQEAGNVWGRRGIPVRKAFARTVFGGRKYSIANSSLITSLNERFPNVPLGGIREIAVNIEMLWQEMVTIAKVGIVIKTPAVVLMNITSNMMVLAVNGIDPVTASRDAIAGIRELRKYEVLNKELSVLYVQLQGAKTREEAKGYAVSITRLKSQLDASPIRPMLEEGMFQSIIEDVDSSKFGYTEKMINYLESKAQNAVGKKVVDAATWLPAQLFMGKNTAVYQLLNKTTQYSDFVARYSYVKRMASKPDAKPMKEIYNDAIDSFINYNIPDQKGLQYMNDMGMVMFTKYWLGIQHVILKMFKTQPVNALTSVIGQAAIMDIADIFDDSIVNKGVTKVFKSPTDVFSSATEMYGVSFWKGLVP